MTFQTATRRLAAVPLGLALALALGAPGARAETAIPPDQGACAVLDSPFTLAEIVEAALAEEPGTVKAAGFTVRPDGMGGRTTLFKVRIRTDDGPRLLFHDLETGERVFPVEPVFSYLEAYDLALGAVAPDSSVLAGRLKRDVFVAGYLFPTADPADDVTFVRVDALTGATSIHTPRQAAKKIVKKRVKKKKKNKKRLRRLLSNDPLDCQEVETEDELDEGLL